MFIIIFYSRMVPVLMGIGPTNRDSFYTIVFILIDSRQRIPLFGTRCLTIVLGLGYHIKI